MFGLDVVTGQIAYGWSHMQKQAPQTKERTKVESHANIMFGPQLKSFMRIFNCFRFQQTCARSSQCFFFYLSILIMLNILKISKQPLSQKRSENEFFAHFVIMSNFLQ